MMKTLRFPPWRGGHRIEVERQHRSFVAMCIFFLSSLIVSSSMALRLEETEEVRHLRSEIMKNGRLLQEDISEEDDEELQNCIDNMLLADRNRDLRLDRSEFGYFVAIQSLGRILYPLENLDFITIFYSEACTQCIEITQEEHCCIGEKAKIVIWEEFLGTEQFLDTIYYVCGTVDHQIAKLFPPTISPSIGVPTPEDRVPSYTPTSDPTMPPSDPPMRLPTSVPTKGTTNPTLRPSSVSTSSPTTRPIVPPTGSPTFRPPTIAPTKPPSLVPTSSPTLRPSNTPSVSPIPQPSFNPSWQPTNTPSVSPIVIVVPTMTPTSDPTVSPSSEHPTPNPTFSPTELPTPQPTPNPTSLPTKVPTPQPIPNPTPLPTKVPTPQPSNNPTPFPTDTPTEQPSILTPNPTPFPTNVPISIPTQNPTISPTISSRPTAVQMVAEIEFPNTTDPSVGAVALLGENLVIGVPGFNNGTGIVQTSQLGGSLTLNIEAGNALKFGSALDLTSSSDQFHMLIGATDTEEIGTGRKFGSVEYYSLVGNEWVRIGNPMVPGSRDVLENGEFGSAVGIATTILRCAVGAPKSREKFNFPSGSVELESGRIFTYEFNGSEWVEMAEPLIGAFTARVGTAVDMSLDGSRLLAGAPAFDAGDGGVAYYVWNPDAASWDSIFTLTGFNSEELGTTVAIISDDGETIAFGGPSFGNDQGRIRVFFRVAGDFLSLGTITGRDGERIGLTLSGSNGMIAVGTATNFARIFQLFEDEWREILSIQVPRRIVSLSFDGATLAVSMEGALTQVFQIV